MIPEILIATAIEALFALIIKGIKALIFMAPEARKKLKAVYLEVCANRTVLAKTAGKKGEDAPHGSQAFIDLANGLSNAETKPLFKESKTVRRSRFIKGSKKREQINRVQYALNYTVRQIDDLKALAKLKTAKGLHLSVRLRTLDKHLETLEKVLCSVKK
jgi:RecA/RadA recombinase